MRIVNLSIEIFTFAFLQWSPASQ
uniref:Uncharacterized protein n=1 Tax=mine drainage metagenome TaxID=410659 RepID=E6Q8I5_9ZZZZ